MLLSFFYQYPYIIHQIVLIVSLLRYLNLLIIKKLINLNSLFYCCCNTILLLCGIFLGFLHLCLYAVYQIVIIISFLKYSNLLIIKKLINLDYLAWYLAPFYCLPHYLAYFLPCCLVFNWCLNYCLTFFCCLAYYLAYCYYLVYCLTYYLAYYLACNCYLNCCLAHFCYLAYCLAYCYYLICCLVYFYCLTYYLACYYYLI